MPLFCFRREKYGIRLLYVLHSADCTRILQVIATQSSTLLQHGDRSGSATKMQTAINSAGCCNKPAGQCNPNLHPSKLWLIVTFATGSSRPRLCEN